jgi:hypothetical protein
MVIHQDNVMRLDCFEERLVDRHLRRQVPSLRRFRPFAGTLRLLLLLLHVISRRHGGDDDYDHRRRPLTSSPRQQLGVSSTVGVGSLLVPFPFPQIMF